MAQAVRYRQSAAKTVLFVLALAVLASFVVFAPGCSRSGAEAKQEWIDKAELGRTMLEMTEQTIDTLADDIAAAVLAGDPQAHQRATAAIEAAKIRRAQLIAGIEEAERMIAEIDEDAEGWMIDLQAIGAVANTVAPYVPQPWGTYIGLGGALVGTIGGVAAKKKSTQAKKADQRLSNVVYALDEGKKESATLKAGLEEVAPIIRSNMGRETATFVDSIRERGIQPKPKTDSGSGVGA